MKNSLIMVVKNAAVKPQIRNDISMSICLQYEYGWYHILTCSVEIDDCKSNQWRGIFPFTWLVCVQVNYVAICQFNLSLGKSKSDRSQCVAYYISHIPYPTYMPYSQPENISDADAEYVMRIMSEALRFPIQRFWCENRTHKDFIFIWLAFNF